MESNSSDDYEHPVATDKPKKRKIKGRKREIKKLERLRSHRTGDDCRCQRKCFESVTEEERETLFTQFNTFKSKDEQDSHLARLIKPKDTAPSTTSREFNGTEEFLLRL
jgi:hypothetical protein